MPRPYVLAGLVLGAMVGVLLAVGAALAVNDSSRGAPPRERMFDARPLARAVHRFESRAGTSVRLWEVIIDSKSVLFLYQSPAGQKSYTVTLPGRGKAIRNAFEIGGHSFALSKLRTTVPSALLVAIGQRTDSAGFSPSFAELSALDTRRPMWLLYGETRSRFLAFQANTNGRDLRETCSSPLPGGPAHPAGC